MDIREKIEGAPDTAGVYIFKDKAGDIIYIGKAASIRNRLKAHLQKRQTQRQKVLVENIADADYIITAGEPAALLLEAALVKRYNPRYNVALRDDKSYPRLKLTVNEEYPRLFITRKVKPDGALYFGPYTSAKLLRKALSFMKRLFPLRTCMVMPKTACLNFHIGQCPAPCVDKEERQGYLKVVEELRLLLDGEQDELLDNLSGQMKRASEDMDYEKAAGIRDKIRALSLVAEAYRKPEFAEAESKIRAAFSPLQQIEELRSILGLPKPPSAIEAFDISNISGREAVGSMVYFKDGKPDKERYRKFRIKTVSSIDDYSMMREIISRRYRRLLEEKAPFPDLIIIDGGRGHLLAARKELHALGIWDIPVISIAKAPDKIYVSEEKEPILVGRHNLLLFLIQRVRDEAHRFAVGYHRLLRRKKLGVSELDNIEGIGPKRKVSLMSHFGSIEEIRMADIEDLKKIRYISEKEAKAIYDHFHK